MPKILKVEFRKSLSTIIKHIIIMLLPLNLYVINDLHIIKGNINC
jgi:hypothetical protein